LKCPRCGNKAYSLGKNWIYGKFNVKLFHCKKCNQNFEAYFLAGILSHTIPTAFSIIKRKIIKYLKSHKAASENELSEILHLKLEDVLNALISLERAGIVERYDNCK
jgi:DNA-binding MarR family transcriptional regulator